VSIRRLESRQLIKDCDRSYWSTKLGRKDWGNRSVAPKRLPRARKETSCASRRGGTFKNMDHTWQEGDVTFRQIMQKCSQLVIDVRAMASQARGRTRCRCLVSRMCGGKCTSRSGRCSKGTEVCITLSAHRSGKTEAG